MPGAAGPTNMDGSPDMTHIKNVKVAEMLGLKSLSVHASTGEDTCKALNDSGCYTESNTKPHSSTYRRRPASSSSSSRPSLSSEDSENIFIAEQMRAVAAPFATKLAWILAVLVVALLHENIECALMITYAAHARGVLLASDYDRKPWGGGLSYGLSQCLPSRYGFLAVERVPRRCARRCDGHVGDKFNNCYHRIILRIIQTIRSSTRAIRMEQVQHLHQSTRCSDDPSGFHLVLRRTYLGTV